MYNTYSTRREILRLGLACSTGLSMHSIIGQEREPLTEGVMPASHFPALQQVINNNKLIYFDTAATAQRPREVIDAVSHFYSHDNANPAPNLHSLAKRAFETYEDARATVASFINARDPLEIVFTRGTTEGINLIASTWGETNIGRGDEIVLTIAEHASNMLPWQILAKRKGARLRYVDVLDSGDLDLDSLQRQLTPRAKLVCFSHVSNVLGVINPATEICRMVREAGAKVLIDAAQSVPHIAVDVQELQCDFLAFSSHKMMGPMGIGVLWVRRSLLDEMPTYQAGSNMAHAVSRDDWEYSEAARKFGAGTPNVSGPVGLAVAINLIRTLGQQQVWNHEQGLTAHLLELLARQKGVRMIGGGAARNRISLCCFTVDSIDPEILARKLDQYGIAIRAGDMASLPLLQRFGVKRAARVSLYLYNAVAEIDEFARRLAVIVNEG